MVRFPGWKIGFIALVVLWGSLAALPNFLGEGAQKSLPSFLPQSSLSLGLDLQGGVHMLLEAETDDVIRTELENLRGQVRDIRRENRDLTFRRLQISGNAVTFEVANEDMIDRAREELRVLTQPAIGLNPLGGAAVQTVELAQDELRFTLSLTDEGISVKQRDAIQRAMEVIRRRVDPQGTRDITVQAQGDNRIILQVPGESDPDGLRRLIETTAKLTFHDVDTSLADEDVIRGRVPPGVRALESMDGGIVPIFTRVIVSGEDLTGASPAFDQNGRPAVNFNFNATGGARFGEHTRKNVNRPFAIVLDDKVISAPRINTPILGGAGQITGNFDIQEAAELATLLEAGSLPVPLNIESQGTVGPQLGADSISAGKLASIIGMVAVVVYMILSYGGFGVAANLALAVNLVLIIGFLSLFQATLTLPGIAGIVLTIGMAVDANVLVFERIREEQAAGKKPGGALESGYAQAFSTILDANITTFIAAAILYLLGSGPVQGFAVTLAVGILTSMFTAILVTRFLLSVWLNWSRPARLPI